MNAVRRRLDQMQLHLHHGFIDAAADTNKLAIEIRTRFKSRCLLCDFGIIKHLKSRFVELFQKSKDEEYTSLGGFGKLLFQDMSKYYSSWLIRSENFQLKLYKIQAEKRIYR